jgi:aquaglyceroporin related protein
MIAVYVAGKSGAHLNPAVTLASCMYRKFPWRKFPVYLVAQVLGCMAAAAVVYGNYKSAIDMFEGGPGIRTVSGATATAGIFCTYPAAFLSRTGMFFSEFVASTILMFCLFGLADNGAGNLMPLMIFFLIFGIGACFGWETGYAINLARDFGPRLVSYMLGYGHEVWSAGNYYFWVSSHTHPKYIPHSRPFKTNKRQTDPNGRPLLRHPLWWLPLRHVPLHRSRQPHQHALLGTPKTLPVEAERLV